MTVPPASKQKKLIFLYKAAFLIVSYKKRQPDAAITMASG